MTTISISESLVSVEWLQENANASNLVILNATIPKVTSSTTIPSEENQIPNSLFFDIKNKFSAVDAPFPSTFPSAEHFTKAAQALGINLDSAIVVYDEKGIYSSARAWWLFKSFGYNNVAVLDGGFPEWKSKKFPIEKKQEHKVYPGSFQASLKPNYMLFFEDILKIQKDAKYTIIDARSSERFTGEISEPRKGLRSGTIPNSINLPFKTLLQNHKMLPKNALQKGFTNTTSKQENLVFSCGSGITACVLALGADLIGYKNIAVYDGSWTEYGTLITKENTMHWTKEELIAYTLLYAANSNMNEDNKERNLIIKKVDMQTFQKIHDEFNADNDYQSIQKIQAGLKAHHFTKNDTEKLLAEIKILFFADGEFDVMERITYRSLKKLLNS
ncbi:MAG: sulfurtransferase [Oceanihabitans sp.]